MLCSSLNGFKILFLKNVKLGILSAKFQIRWYLDFLSAAYKGNWTRFVAIPLTWLLPVCAFGRNGGTRYHIVTRVRVEGAGPRGSQTRERQSMEGRVSLLPATGQDTN